MNQLKRIYKNHYVFWRALALNLLMLLSLSLFFYPRYDADADIFMQVMLAGGNGTATSSAHIVFSNVILGGVLSVLYTHFPTVAWYYYFYVISSFFAIFIIGYFLLKKNNTKLGVVITVVVTAFLGCECYCLPVYLKTSAVLCMAMCFALIQFISRDVLDNWKLFVIAIFFGVLSILISWKAFLIVLISCIVPFLVYVFGNHISIKKLWLPFATILMILVVMLTLVFVDRHSYSDPYWDLSKVYGGSMEQLLSFGSMDYDDVVELLPEDMTEANYNLLKQGYFINESNETFEIIKTVTSQRESFSGESLLYFFRHIPIKMFNTGMFYLWVILAYVIFAFGCKNNKLFFGNSVFFGLFGLVVLYYMEALDYTWMYAIAMLPMTFYMLLCLKDLHCDDTRIVVVYTLVVAVVLYNKFGSTLRTSVMEDDMTVYITDILNAELEEDEEPNDGMIDLSGYIRSFPVTADITKNIPSYAIHSVDGVYSLIPDFDLINTLDDTKKKKKRTWISNPSSVKLQNVWDEAERDLE